MGFWALWSRRPKQPTMETPVLLDEPPFFEGWRTVRLFVGGFAFVVLLGFVGVGAVFFSGIETAPPETKKITVPLDNSILRE